MNISLTDVQPNLTYHHFLINIIIFLTWTQSRGWEGVHIKPMIYEYVFLTQTSLMICNTPKMTLASVINLQRPFFDPRPHESGKVTAFTLSILLLLFILYEHKICSFLLLLYFTITFYLKIYMIMCTLRSQGLV